MSLFHGVWFFCQCHRGQTIFIINENNVTVIMVTPNNDLHSLSKPPLIQSLLFLFFLNT